METIARCASGLIELTTADTRRDEAVTIIGWISFGIVAVNNHELAVRIPMADPDIVAVMSTGTPATALLAREKVVFRLHPYEHDPRSAAFGEEAATALGVDPERIFKTLIAAIDGKLTCAVVPVAARLDLKAFAAALGGKRAELADPAAAARATGYVIGGISPIGQKARLRVVLDSSAQLFETVYVSAGKRGLQVQLMPADLVRVTSALVAPISTT